MWREAVRIVLPNAAVSAERSATFSVHIHHADDPESLSSLTAMLSGKWLMQSLRKAVVVPAMRDFVTKVHDS